jgi:hypothetical protein
MKRHTSARTTTTDPSTFGDAEWLAHRYDPEHDAVHFLRVPRATHRTATFLTDDYLERDLKPIVVRRSEAIAIARPPAPIHFVFHSAYCCSTLVARAFDAPGWAMGLKEPTILNDIVGWRRRGGQGPDMAAVLNDVLALLARPFSPGEVSVVKPSNIVNGLAAAMLTLRPEAKALLLYAPLRTYLTSIAKKGMDGRLWARTLLLGLIDDKLVNFGYSARDHVGQTDLQVAAIGWLAQHALFAKLVEQFGFRVRSLNSDLLTSDPALAMTGLAAHFGLPMNAERLGGIISGPAFTSHSKTREAFASADRIQEHLDSARIHGDEVEKVAVWTEVVAQTFAIPIDLPNRLATTSGL